MSREPWFAAPRRACPNCQGFGRVRDSMRAEPVPCARCDGRGSIADEPANSHPRTDDAA